MENTKLKFEEESIFSCECHEPKGVVERHVYPMMLSPENLTRFWEKASQFKVLFWDTIDGNFEKFASMLISKDGDHLSANGLFWRVDDFVGVFYMTHIQAFDAQIHYTFFDRRTRGRQVLTRRMIQYVFREFGFQRLSAEIPCYLNPTFKFIEDIGLKYEGRKRNAAFYDNQWFDTKLYSILREEAESWA